MSVMGILSSDLFSAGATQNIQSNNPSNFQKIHSEFQQLGQDLQSGNLTQAQQDYTTLTQNLPGFSQNSTNPLAQALNQLGQDLQSGNLQAAQQDYATVQQDAQQSAAQVAGHHHHHHHRPEGTQDSSASQQNNPIAQAFSQLAQDLQSGNLQGAQQAFATLQSDLQQIGGFAAAGSSSASGAAATTGSLNVTA